MRHKPTVCDIRQMQKNEKYISVGIYRCVSLNKV